MDFEQPANGGSAPDIICTPSPILGEPTAEVKDAEMADAKAQETQQATQPQTKRRRGRPPRSQKQTDFLTSEELVDIIAIQEAQFSDGYDICVSSHPCPFTVAEETMMTSTATRKSTWTRRTNITK
jgi:hypothetical protein